MKKIKLLSALLFAGAFALSAQGGAFAATTASQTVTGTLSTCRSVVTDGGNIASAIDCETGNLATAFTPAFKMTTNTATSQALYIKAECNTTTGLVNALSGTGATGATFISLTTAGETGLPIAAAVTDAQAAVPVPASNGNVITYGVDRPSLAAGLTYTDFASVRWNMALAKKGETSTTVTVPAAAPKALTYSFDDEPGAYASIVTLSFV